MSILVVSSKGQIHGVRTRAFMRAVYERIKEDIKTRARGRYQASNTADLQAFARAGE